MTLKGHNTLWNVMFQAVSGHILEMVRKPENQPSLLLMTNKKWHTPFQIRLD